MGPRSSYDSDRSTNSDDALVDAMRRGDAYAFEQLVRRYASPLRAFAFSFLGNADAAEDVVQEVFVRLWETREALAPAGTIAGHLFGAVRFRALAALKHTRVEQRYQERVLQEQRDDVVRGESAPDLVVEHADLYAAAVRAAHALPAGARAVFLMRWNQGLSHREIAERLGISVKGVEVQLTRALKTIRRLLTDAH